MKIKRKKNNAVLNNNSSKTKVQIKISELLKISVIKIPYQDIWGTIKTVIRGNYITLNNCANKIKELKKGLKF